MSKGNGPKKRWLWWIVGVIVASALLFLGLRPRPVQVEVGTVDRGPLEVTLDEEGETRVRERFVVSAPLAGRVLRIDLEPGDEVVAGETVLAAFLPSEPVLLDARSRAEAQAAVRAAEASLGQAEALYEQAAAEVGFARSEVARSRNLATDGILSAERLELSEVNLETKQEAAQAAGYAVATARSQLEVARARLLQASGEAPQGGGAIRLEAPVDGVVLRRLRESEAVVPAGEPLLEIGDPADLEIVADYLSSDAVQMRPGQRVYIERWGGGDALLGRVRRIEPSGFTKISALGVEEQRVNVIIDFDEPPARYASLGDGFRVEVRVAVWQDEDVVRAPTGALFRHGESWAVYCVEGSRAVLRSVEVGAMNPQAAEVQSGLEAGDRVILHPSDSVEEGVRVEVRAS